MQNTQDTALLVMDMQSAILRNLQDTTELIANVNNAITFANDKGLPVCYIVVGFRPNVPEVSANNKAFAMLRERIASVGMDEWIKVHPDVLMNEDAVIVTKKRFSAFTGSDLEILLRAKNIRHIVLSGVSTSGVVLSTTREAADKDYRITILSDCCADADAEVHRVLTAKIFPRQAEVITVAEWIQQQH